MSDKEESDDSRIVTFLRKKDFRMVRKLGQGAFGRTVLLHCDQLDEHFVCKKYHPYMDSLKVEYFANFCREIKLLHRVHHRNVVRVFSYYLYPEQFTGYLLMEFVDGKEVDAYVLAHPENINDVFKQTLTGFVHLEENEILHRDIRTRNLMVTDEGLVKIIDLGCGKKASQPIDFDKSITLNWWCETPEEFSSQRYDFGTEVYFVGKLFEALVREQRVYNFNYNEQLRKMCYRNPTERFASFSAVLQSMHNEKFTEVAFSDAELQAYRLFAAELCEHITKIENSAKYVIDLKKIVLQLSDAFQKVMLEDTVPDCAVVTRCFIDGNYYYVKAGFPVQRVRDFLNLLRSSTSDRQQILLANLHSRFDSIPRYPNEPVLEEDIPF